MGPTFLSTISWSTWENLETARTPKALYRVLFPYESLLNHWSCSFCELISVYWRLRWTGASYHPRFLSTGASFILVNCDKLCLWWQHHLGLLKVYCSPWCRQWCFWLCNPRWSPFRTFWSTCSSEYWQYLPLPLQSLSGKFSATKALLIPVFAV